MAHILVILLLTGSLWRFSCVFDSFGTITTPITLSSGPNIQCRRLHLTVSRLLPLSIPFFMFVEVLYLAGMVLQRLVAKTCCKDLLQRLAAKTCCKDLLQSLVAKTCINVTKVCHEDFLKRLLFKLYSLHILCF